MVGVLLTEPEEPDSFSLLLGVAEELHDLIVVAEANDKHGIVLIMVDLIGNTDTTGSEERNSMSEIVATQHGVVGQVKGLLGSHKVQSIEGLIALAVVGDGDSDLVERIETDVDIVLHVCCVLCVLLVPS